MLLINNQQLELNALRDDQHPLHSYAEEYKKGIEFLKETYGEQLKLIRPGFPKKVKGFDHRGKEVNNLTEPITPMRVPLQARVQGKVGMEIWDYCKGAPKLMPNQLWEPTGKRGLFVDESIKLSLRKDADLAFFLYYKSPFLPSGLLKIDDPTAEARVEGDKARAELDLQTALYGVLADEDQLRVVAQAYGILGTATKHPDALRKELKGMVLLDEKKKRTDPTAKGIKGFLEEMKVTDSVRLRSLVMTMVENKRITWPGDGRYKIGEREICRIPSTELANRQNFLCNHLLNPANRTKLQELLRDVIDKEYLDKISDEKTFIWLARVMGLQYNFKSADEVRESVYAEFVPLEFGEEDTLTKQVLKEQKEKMMNLGDTKTQAITPLGDGGYAVDMGIINNSKPPKAKNKGGRPKKVVV